MFSPIIIIGMHRSGTSMVTDLLEEMGLFLGWLVQENSEAVFFLERNQALLKSCGGDWDYPNGINGLLSCDPMRKAAAAQLHREIKSASFLSFLGPRHAYAWRRDTGLDCPWGWKDPRNTFLLPLWLELFPDARVIHIIRHPLDVACSLQVRERRVLTTTLSKSRGTSCDQGLKAGQPAVRRERGALYLHRRIVSLRDRLGRFSRYQQFRVPSIVSLDAGVDLWRQYVSRAVEHTRMRPNHSISIRYEDFLVSPREHLRRLARFCGLAVEDTTIDRLCGRQKIERRLAFKSNPEALAILPKIANDPLACELGYSEE